MAIVVMQTHAIARAVPLGRDNIAVGRVLAEPLLIDVLASTERFLAAIVFGAVLVFLLDFLAGIRLAVGRGSLHPVRLVDAEIDMRTDAECRGRQSLG